MRALAKAGSLARRDRGTRQRSGGRGGIGSKRWPALFPLCDGRVLTVRARRGKHGRVRQEFCEMYYRLNCIAVRIQRLRSVDSVLARKLWRALSVALRCRDALEDRWSPRGVIAEPVLSAGLVMDLRFTFPDIDALGQPRLGLAGTSSAAVIVVGGEARVEEVGEDWVN